jgi:hypothetical protein
VASPVGRGKASLRVLRPGLGVASGQGVHSSQLAFSPQIPFPAS